MSIKTTLIGDTIEITWVDSGVTPSDIHASLWTGSETLVNSLTMTDSLNGHFFALMTLPDDPGYYVAETLAVIQTFPYKRRVKVRAVLGEVD